MLEETNKALINLKEQHKLVAIKKAKRKYLFNLYKKYTIRIFLFSVIFCIIFFPLQSGTIIGTWINSFFGTIYNIVFQSVR